MAAPFAVDTRTPSSGDVNAESRLAPFSGENSLAAENARLTMLLHEQLGVVRGMQQQVSELGNSWATHRRAYEARIRELELQLTVARAVAASAHGDAPLPSVPAVPIEGPTGAPYSTPPTIELPQPAPPARVAATSWRKRAAPPHEEPQTGTAAPYYGPFQLPAPGLAAAADGGARVARTTADAHAPLTRDTTAPLPAAAADSGFRRRGGSNPGVMEEGTAAAASQPPSAGASADMTTDDVLATMGF